MTNNHSRVRCPARAVMPIIVAISLIISAVTLTITGCSDKTGPGTTGIETKEELTELDDNEYYLDDAIENGMNGVYLQKGGKDTVTLLEITSREYGFDTGAEYAKINRDKGDRLVIIGDITYDDFIISPVKDHGYCDISNPIGSMGNYLAGLDELDGQEFSSEKEGMSILKDQGFYVISDDWYMRGKSNSYALVASKEKDAEITWGQYQGTDFVEGEFTADTPYYAEEDDSFSLPANKSKNGYFSVDLSSLSTKGYLMSLYFDGVEGEQVYPFLIKE